MDNDQVLAVLKKAVSKTTDECREIARYVLMGKQHGYKCEDEIVFKAILFHKLRVEFTERLAGLPKGGDNSVTLELTVSPDSLPTLRKQTEGEKFKFAKIDIAISDDNPWLDLERQAELILIEVKNPIGISKDGILTKQDEIHGHKGIERDIDKLNQLKKLLPDKFTTVMVVAHTGNKGALNKTRILERNLLDARKVDHLLIF